MMGGFIVPIMQSVAENVRGGAISASGHWVIENNQQRSYASCCRFCARFSVLISLTGAFSPAPRHQKITGNAESKAATAQQYITNSYPSV